MLWIFHHDDADGQAAAYLVRKYAEAAGIETTWTTVEVNYYEPFPLQLISSGDEVWIVDFHITAKEMSKLLDVASDIYWIDHHKTHIHTYARMNDKHLIKGVQRTDNAACVLVHEFARKHFGHHTTEIPEWLALVEDWDIWKWEYGDRTRRFHFGTFIYETDPASQYCIWRQLDVKAISVNEVIKAGELIVEYKDAVNEKKMKDMAYEVTFEDCRCLALNSAGSASDFTDFVDSKYSVFILYSFNGKAWRVSLRSSEVDVSVIAKKYKGGGHVGAAGFWIERLPEGILKT